MRVLALTFALVAPVWAGEYAVLSNGFRLHAERHATDGAVTTLYDGNGGYTAVRTTEITAFEAEDYVPFAAAEASPAAPPPASGVPSLVQQAAERHGLHPALISSVIAAESAFHPRAVSPKGAQGLMQLMPGTARELRVENPFDAAQNVEGGTVYLRQLWKRYQGYPNQLERAVAAYNAGPAKVDRYGGLPPYRETVDFVSRVSTRLKFLMAERQAQ
jgi:soluble lytic murein transglycosylase-like protein